MIGNSIKIEICKEVLIKSGQSNNKDVIDSIAESVMNDRFIFELNNNEVIVFVTWKVPQEIDGKNKIFINNLWIDSRYRNKDYVLKIRTSLRNIFGNTSGVWFNRKKQKMIERI